MTNATEYLPQEPTLVKAPITRKTVDIGEPTCLDCYDAGCVACEDTSEGNSEVVPNEVQLVAEPVNNAANTLRSTVDEILEDLCDELDLNPKDLAAMLGVRLGKVEEILECVPLKPKMIIRLNKLFPKVPIEDWVTANFNSERNQLKTKLAELDRREKELYARIYKLQEEGFVETLEIEPSSSTYVVSY